MKGNFYENDKPVSVSAVAYCMFQTVTRSLCLIKKIIMSIETSNDRYGRLLLFFKEELLKNPRVSLRECCALHRINLKTMETWLHRHHVSVKALRIEADKDFQKESVLVSEQPSPGFVSLLPSGDTPVLEMLQGVSVTFPDGTVVTVRKCTPMGLTCFINKYICGGEEVASCSR